MRSVLGLDYSVTVICEVYRRVKKSALGHGNTRSVHTRPGAVYTRSVHS